MSAPSRPGEGLLSKASLQRLLACLAGSIVLAMMIGPQEGSNVDYGYSFHQAVLKPRIAIFLVLGVLLFLAITFWPLLARYVSRAGFWPLISGSLAVVVAQTLMSWYDPLGKFGPVHTAVSKTPGINWTASTYFGWLGWTQLAVLLVLGLVAIVLALRPLAWAVAVLCVPAAVIVVCAHTTVVNKGGGIDHSLGYAAAVLGFAVIASGMIASAITPGQASRGRDAAALILGFRPGLPLVLVGLIVTLLGDTVAVWFSPGHLNLTMSATRHQFLSTSTPLDGFASDMMAWLGWLMLAAAIVVCAAASWLRQKVLAWVGAVIGAAGSLMAVIAMYQVSDAGAKADHFDSATGPWQNLGTGGWMTAGGLFLIGAGGVVAALATRVQRRPAVEAPTFSGKRSFLAAPGAARSAAAVAAAVALFYPPMTTAFWQQVLVSEIGISLLLAVGLNVVVGWAGLLDLGFIAFYAIGSYVTAYLTDALPVKPPAWLHFSPLVAIPFAIVACLIAGLILGAPTLRLRGDYLAIVTLGFGEIIQIVAVNAKGFTLGSQGPSTVPPPAIHIGPVHLVWGLNQLQYWYLLLVIIVVIVLAFRRLEHSRLGRAWAAVREDEVAAQSTGVNTTRVKLMAFAIGASTSGIAGVFFASQIGAFTPGNFLLNNSILIVAYVVFGGMGSLTGAMAGAALLTWLPEFLKSEVPSADRLMWIGAIVLLMMIFRPEGLIPARRRRIEMHEEAYDMPSAETHALSPSGSLGSGVE